jgi:hypothetical protein
MDINGRNSISMRHESDEEYEITGSVKSQEDLLKLMRNPAYKNDPQYRKQVELALQRGMQQGHEVRVADPKGPDHTQQKNRAVVMEVAREMFRDPRYKTSAIYREEVAQYIKANGHVYDELNRDTQINNMLADGTRRQHSVAAGEVSTPEKPSK